MKFDLAEHVPGTPQRYRHGWIPVDGPIRSRGEALADDGEFKNRNLDFGDATKLIDSSGSVDRLVMQRYSGSLAQPMNGALRRGEHTYDKKVAVIDAAMGSLKQPTLLFRTVPPKAFGIDMSNNADPDEIVSALAPLVGRTITDKGFLSTSFKSTNGMIKNTKIIIKIKAPAGTKAILMRPYSNYPQESEILVHRDARMRVDRIEKVKGDYGGQVIVHGELL